MFPPRLILLTTLSALLCFGCKPNVPPPAPSTPTPEPTKIVPKASPTPTPATGDFTGEKAANIAELKQGQSLPEATAEVPPAPAIPVITRVLYVAPTTAPKNTGLTPDSPLSPQKAAYLTLPGDVVLFAEGEYEAVGGRTLLSIERSGEPGKPIIYSPAPGAKVTLRSNGAWECIKVAGASYIEIRNFRVIGNTSLVTMDEAIQEMSNMKNPRTCGNGIGINWKEPEKVPPHHVTVSNCVVSDCSGGGIYASHMDYLTFEGNIVFRCAFWSPYGNSGISVYQPIDTDENTTDYKVVIRNNVSFGNYENIPFFHSNRADPTKRKITDGNGIILDDFMNSQAWGNTSGKPYGGRTLVANNVIFANGGSGIHAFKSNHVDVFHNFAYDNNKHPNLKDGQIFGNNSKNMRIQNNILVAPAGKLVTSNHKNTDLVQDHNIYANIDGSTPKLEGPAEGNILANPGVELVGWTTGKREIKIASESPARAAGLILPDASPDFFGKARNAATPDIGPFLLDAK